MVRASFNRSALVFHGFNPAPDVAGMDIDERGQRHIVRWSDVMQHRRERQQEQLRRKREYWIKATRAYRLTVAYYDQPLMGGWQAMIEDWRGRGFDIWIDRDRQWLRAKLMAIFPLVFPLGSEREQWEQWKPEFAVHFERRQHDKKPLGVAYLWWDGSGMPSYQRWF